MSTLPAALNSIPATVWSALVGAVLALAGVFVSNRGNTYRLKIQLRHDATEKAKERTSTLRREVYLRTIEELVKANAHLAGLPQLDVSKTNLGDGLAGFFSAAARLQLVAEPKTALLVNRLAGAYGELMLELMIDLLPVSHGRSDIAIADGMYTQTQENISRLLSEMAKINESGKFEPQAFSALNSSLAFHRAQAAQYAESRSVAWGAFNGSAQAFQRRLLGRLRDLASQQMPVMLEMRRDLGLTGDLAEIEAQMLEQLSRMGARFEKLIEALRDD